jgi:hypothetical protein
LRMSPLPPVDPKAEAARKRAALEARRVPLAMITAADKKKIAQLVQARGRGEFVERELKDLADHVLYAMVGEVKVKCGETKRGLHKWLEKLSGESALRARCLRYLCDASYVSGGEIKRERKRRRTAGGNTAQ